MLGKVLQTCAQGWQGRAGRGESAPYWRNNHTPYSARLKMSFEKVTCKLWLISISLIKYWFKKKKEIVQILNQSNPRDHKLELLILHSTLCIWNNRGIMCLTGNLIRDRSLFSTRAERVIVLIAFVTPATSKTWVTHSVCREGACPILLKWDLAALSCLTEWNLKHCISIGGEWALLSGHQNATDSKSAGWNDLEVQSESV